MSATYEALLAAGAPPLPEGLFYRVDLQEGSLGSSVRVQLRERAPLRYWKGRSRLLAERTVNPYYRVVGRDALGDYREEKVTDALQRVADVCRAVAADRAEAIEARALRAAYLDLEGDHP